MRALLLLFCLFLVCLESQVKTNPVPKSKPSTCGYESCPATKKNMLNVHLIPHTHDDVGWLKTVDQYYYGLKPDVQKAGVQYILDSVIDELLKDKSRRFIYVEIAYFWKWWAEQTDSRRHQVKKLVQNGQLEFIGGGWSMNDEAAVNYQSTIDQFTWGFRKLNDTFGYCGRPRVGWQIDPFGHSRETASIMARLGFDGLFFGRLDYQDKDARLQQKRAEMIWQGSPKNLGNSANLFTGVLFNTYSPPPSFCFDILCNDEPIVDNKKSPDYNAERRVKGFLRLMEIQSRFYASNHIIVTMGDDFNYQNANIWFKNMDKLIRVANAMQVNGSDVNLLYSTPSCYLKAVNDENLSYTTKDDDFFPYASDPHTYWTGYFSSRPTLKYFERKGNNFLQICKQLYALTDLGPEDKVELNSLRNAMGVMQHHDAITGTEKQVVAFDYARLLYDGITKCEDVAEVALRKLTEKQPQVETPNPNQYFPFTTCPLLNITQCEITENFDSFVITLYNPLSYPVTKNVRLPVKDDKHGYVVLCPMGKEQVSQIVPIPESVQNIPGRFSQASYELVFRAYNLPPLGFRSYYITKSGKRLPNGGPLMSVPSQRFQTQYTTIGNQACFNVRKTFTGPLNSGFPYNARAYQNFDSTSTTNSNCLKFSAGEEGSFLKRGSGAAVPLNQGFYFYRGAVGDNMSFQNRSSGAYIFRPNGSDPYIIGDRVKRETFKGPVVEEIHETYSDWVSQVIRVYKGDNHAEFEWLVGPIPVEDGIGKEVIHRFNSTIQSHGIFYTDSNGREMLERVRNHRPTWNVSIAEPISSNYYPITSKITVKDDQFQMSILNDRAQGGSSINDGEVELMVHRRCLRDDAFGVGEALNEMAFGKGLVARGTHYLTFGSPQSQNSVERTLALEKLLDVWTFLTPTPITSFDQWRQNFKMEYSGLNEALPKNIHILTLEPWKGSTMLLRLEHTFEVGEDPTFSVPVTVDIRKLFYPFTITSFEETTLGGNMFVKDLKRMHWKTETNSVNDQFNSEDFINYKQYETTRITLKPMEIRTFIIEVQFKKFSL